MRLKILGLVAMAALVAALGAIGLAREAARADAVPIPTVTPSPVASGATALVSGFFNEDDTCAAGAGNCSILVSVTPANAVVSLTLNRCDIDVNGNGSVADEAAVAPAAGNCVGAVDSDGVTTNNTFSMTGAVVAGLRPNAAPDTITPLWRLNLDLICSSLAGTLLTVTYQQDNIVAQTQVSCTGSAGNPILAIGKIDQNNGYRTALFGLFSQVGALNPSADATMLTSTTLIPGQSTASNPCLSNTNCATNPNTNPGNVGGGDFPPLQSGGITIPINTSFEIREISQPANCTLVEIKLGTHISTTILPLSRPVVVRFDGAGWTVMSDGVPYGTVNGLRLDLTYVNSCQIPGGANAAGSALAIVIGGASYGLTNTTHLEIIPAPGSDDDARLDVRVRDSNNVPLIGAHVTIITDKGYIAMRYDTTGTGSTTPSGYDVVEPSNPNFGSKFSGDTCDQFPFQGSPNAPFNGSVTRPFFTGSTRLQDGYTDASGIISACLYVGPDMDAGITPGRANIQVIVENTQVPTSSYWPIYAPQNLLLTGTVTVVGPPASVRVAASPTSLQCGEKATITATVTDAIGQNVSDHTRIELVSNYGSTIGGTGATLGFPGVGPVNPLSSSAAETFSGVATAFLLTSTEHVGPYEVVVATGGSVGGVYNFFSYGYLDQNTRLEPFAQPGVTYGTGAFSTAPVSAQVTVTCSLPVVAAPSIPIPPIAAPRTGEGIRPPNTGDAGLADASGNGWALVLAGAAAFVLAGVASVKFARR